MPRESMSLPMARRLALAAQGLHRPRPAGRPDRRHLRRLIADVGLLQIDSVNVLARSHYLPGWSRLGPYPREVLDAMAYRDHELFEYWGHEASLLPVDVFPLLRWRMARAAEAFETWGAPARLAQDDPGYIEAVLDEVRARGPIAAGELTQAGARGTDDWGWNWSPGKVALEWLFWTGQVTAADRRNFERRYDLPERVLPARVLATPPIGEDDAQRALLLRAARHLGVATATDLADYYRIKIPAARARLAELVEGGDLLPVTVRGWRHPAYTLPDPVIPRRVDACAVLSPFDSVVWERPRAERLWGFSYRLEIYVPAAKRQHGYYVLPFLLGDRLVGRVDLKSDRKAGVLRVQAAHVEPDVDHAEAAHALAGELAALADWLGLTGGVAVTGPGDLAPALARAVAA